MPSFKVRELLGVFKTQAAVAVDTLGSGTQSKKVSTARIRTIPTALRDNFRNFARARPDATVGDFSRAFAIYAKVQLSRAAGSDGVLDASEVSGLPKDLRDNVAETARKKVALAYDLSAPAAIAAHGVYGPVGGYEKAVRAAWKALLSPTSDAWYLASEILSDGGVAPSEAKIRAYLRNVCLGLELLAPGETDESAAFSPEQEWIFRCRTAQGGLGDNGIWVAVDRASLTASGTSSFN